VQILFTESKIMATRIPKTPAVTAYVEREMAVLDTQMSRLVLLEEMWSDPYVQCYNDKGLPGRDELEDGSVFLAGPTSRHQTLEYNWRCEAVAYLREAGFKGFIYVPEPRGLEKKDADFTDREYIHYWESYRLFGPGMKTGATLKVVWIPRDADELLGLNTNLEFGIILGKVSADEEMSIFVGWPDLAERMGLPAHYSVVLQGVKRHNTLRRLCYAVMGKVPPEDLVDLDDDMPF
jgi:hypothetical protein